MREKIWGKVIDEEGRCTHYHQENDIVALKCSDCEKYFSCYHCHDELENHLFR
ncbi:MAG: CHY zinc finger protein, partial [Lactococcus lactis]